MASLAAPVMAAPAIDDFLPLMDGVNMTDYIVAAIILVNVGLAVAMGKAKADSEADVTHSRGHLMILIVTTITWLAVGVAMGALGWNDAILSGASTEVMPTDQVLAALMLVLHIASGVCIFVATYGYLTSDYYRGTTSRP